MVPHLIRFAVTAFTLVGIAGSAQALMFADLTLNNCDSMGCEGSTLYLSVQEEAAGSWFVTYRINTTGYTGDRLGFNQVGYTAIDGWTSGTVLSSPVGSLTDWNPVFDDPVNSGSPNSSVCETSNGDTDEVCVRGFVNITGGGDYTWTFRIDDGTLITDTSEWHLGGQYANGNYRTAGKIISAEGGAAPMPEPTAAVLFGLGAILVTRSIRRQ